ncbi:hypothetical protein IDH44_26140 [Paenibacillus sp. IB182496]|uniref:Uncharacterized protein n=1 Tax=Paenibacillus sabuli TaxID=2772509 RepID=A0A927BXF5_9BACL|nr:hypothetical protein [Paenibacillus sabuli]MBD2848666.1 hypothetical protein [Paenibacillus sabuli]
MAKKQRKVLIKPDANTKEPLYNSKAGNRFDDCGAALPDLADRADACFSCRSGR